MHHQIYHNGRVTEYSKTGISPLSGGVVHGYGVFTTLRVYHGKPFLFEDHWQRLEEHSAKVGLKLNWSKGAVLDGLLELIAANRLDEGKARISLLQGENLYWRTRKPKEETDLLIFTAPLLKADYAEVSMTISPYRVHSSSPITGVKTLNYLQPLLTVREAEVRGFEEAVVLNERGEVVGAGLANLFWVRGGVLYTPVLSTGCLAGVTRRLILRLARRLRLETVEGAFHTEHVLGAEEVFLTSSTRELTSVAAINYHHFQSRPRSVFEKLLRAFKETVIC